MTLLYITNGITGSGGLERVLSIKLSMLTEEYGYKIHLIVLNEFNPKPFYHFSPKITYHTLEVNGNPAKYLFKYIKGIKKIISETKPDLISVCDDGVKGLLFPAIFGKKIPVIYERHASIDIFKKEKQSVTNKIKMAINFLLIKFSAKKFDRFVVLTKSNLSEWNMTNTMVIPNPLPFYNSKFAQLKNKKVISVGSHSYIKGFDRLLIIWEKVLMLYPEWKLEIYGKSNPKFNLDEMIRTKKLTNSVLLFEPVKNIQEKYMDASIYVMASRSEGFGMVLAEAMSCGVPCIAFDCPQGPKDIINDGIDGFLIEDNNIKAFVDKLTLLIDDSKKRELMGKIAKKNAKQFMPTEIIKRWDTLFKNLLK